MSLHRRTKLGPYEVLEPLGAGCMGEVYKGRDARLNRAVAIKICGANFSERFERKARAIAALNHPHICALYDVGPDYLILELVDGPTLSAKIAAGPIAMEEAMGIAYFPRIAHDHFGHVGLGQVVQPGCTGPFLEGYR